MAIIVIAFRILKTIIKCSLMNLKELIKINSLNNWLSQFYIKLLSSAFYCELCAVNKLNRIKQKNSQMVSSMDMNSTDLGIIRSLHWDQTAVVKIDRVHNSFTQWKESYIKDMCSPLTC